MSGQLRRPLKRPIRGRMCTVHVPKQLIDTRLELLRTDLLGVGGALEHAAGPTAQGGCDGEDESDSLRISHCRRTSTF
jgi:hypothetical protein